VEGLQVALGVAAAVETEVLFFLGAPHAALRAAAWRPPRVHARRAGSVYLDGPRGASFQRCTAPHIILQCIIAHLTWQHCRVGRRGIVLVHAQSPGLISPMPFPA